MKLIDWLYLRNAIAIFICLLFASGALFWVAIGYHGKISEQYHAQQREFSEAKRRYDEARRNRSLYQQYLSEYRRYMDAGFIGDEQRLSWMEQLQGLNEEYKLASMNYEISPQEQAELPGLSVPSSISLNVSRMKLQAGLLHEGDAVSLWEELRSQSKGFYAIKECALTASGIDRSAAIDYRPYTANVDMACELDWYTIKVAERS